MPDETDLNQLVLEDLGDTLHQRLHTERRLRRVCRHLPTDFQPYGKAGGETAFRLAKGRTAFGWEVLHADGTGLLLGL